MKWLRVWIGHADLKRHTYTVHFLHDLGRHVCCQVQPERESEYKEEESDDEKKTPKAQNGEEIKKNKL